MKKYLVIFIILILCSGCEYFNNFDIVNNDTEKEVDIARPIFAGRDVIVYDLGLYVPTDFTSNGYNGTYDIYEYYTGYATGSGPSGVDILIKSRLVDNSFDIEKWIINESTAKKNGASINNKKINGYNWYVGTINYSNYYYATFNNRLYEVSITKKDDPTVEYESAKDMLDKSLYFQK